MPRSSPQKNSTREELTSLGNRRGAENCRNVISAETTVAKQAAFLDRHQESKADSSTQRRRSPRKHNTDLKSPSPPPRGRRVKDDSHQQLSSPNSSKDSSAVTRRTSPRKNNTNASSIPQEVTKRKRREQPSPEKSPSKKHRHEDDNDVEKAAGKNTVDGKKTQVTRSLNGADCSETNSHEVQENCSTRTDDNITLKKSSGSTMGNALCCVGKSQKLSSEHKHSSSSSLSQKKVTDYFSKSHTKSGDSAGVETISEKEKSCLSRTSTDDHSSTEGALKADHGHSENEQEALSEERESSVVEQTPSAESKSRSKKNSSSIPETATFEPTRVSSDKSNSTPEKGSDEKSLSDEKGVSNEECEAKLAVEVTPPDDSETEKQKFMSDPEVEVIMSEIPASENTQAQKEVYDKTSPQDDDEGSAPVKNGKEASQVQEHHEKATQQTPTVSDKSPPRVSEDDAMETDPTRPVEDDHAKDTPMEVETEGTASGTEAMDMLAGISESDFQEPSDSQATESYSQEIFPDVTENDTNPSTSHSKETSDTDNDIESDSNDARSCREERKQTKTQTKKKQVVTPKLLKKWSDLDTWEYRNGYPGKEDSKNLDKNLLFYTNEISSKPDGGYIDDIHASWWGDYRRLEIHHGYIQWLFPIREKGMNFQSQELQNFEAEAIRSDPVAKKRVLKSYEMMLNFYGIRLVDPHLGRLERAKNWTERFKHLNSSFHNYLRITRILKSLGELGYEYLKVPFVEFILDEAFVEKTLTNCRKSCCDYWIHTIRDNEERIRLAERAEKLERENPLPSTWRTSRY